MRIECKNNSILRTLNFKKCVLPLPNKVGAIQSLKRPYTIKELKEIIRLIIFYHHSIPNLA